MEKSSFFNSEIINGEYDRVYLAEDYANYFSSFIGNGIFPNPSNGLKVSADGDNMKIRIAAGKAWINGYYYENDSDLIFNLSPADGVLNRVDKVVLRLDLVEREISIKVKQGTFASNPVSEKVERNVDIHELALADIKIQNGTISIVNSSINDLRLNSDLCGIVHGVVDQVDTTDIFNTYQQYLNEKLNSNEFNEWFISLKNKLNPYEDLALQLQLQVDELESKIFNIEESVGENLKDQLESKADKDGKLQTNLNADMLDGKHASGTLLTNEKENLVIAINEVFTNASNAKADITGVVGDKDINSNSTFKQIKNKIQTDKNNLAVNLNDKGITCSGSEALENLVGKVADIKKIDTTLPLVMDNSYTLTPTGSSDYGDVYDVAIDNVTSEILFNLSYYYSYGATLDSTLTTGTIGGLGYGCSIIIAPNRAVYYRSSSNVLGLKKHRNEELSSKTLSNPEGSNYTYYDFDCNSRSVLFVCSMHVSDLSTQQQKKISKYAPELVGRGAQVIIAGRETPTVKVNRTTDELFVHTANRLIKYDENFNKLFDITTETRKSLNRGSMFILEKYNQVYILENNYVSCYNTSSGNLNFKIMVIDESKYLTTLFVDNDKCIYVADSSNIIHKVDGTTHEVLWSTRSYGKINVSRIVKNNKTGHIYFPFAARTVGRFIEIK